MKSTAKVRVVIVKERKYCGGVMYDVNFPPFYSTHFYQAATLGILGHTERSRQRVVCD